MLIYIEDIYQGTLREEKTPLFIVICGSFIFFAFWLF